MIVDSVSYIAQHSRVSYINNNILQRICKVIILKKLFIVCLGMLCLGCATVTPNKNSSTKYPKSYPSIKQNTDSSIATDKVDN